MMSNQEYQKKYSSRKTECSICADEVYNRKLIKCPFCDISICDDCIKTFLMSIDDINPRCMSCKKVWTLSFLYQNFNTKFDNEQYRQRRAEITLQREKSLLPATQEVALREKARQEIEAFSVICNKENRKIENIIFNNKYYKICYSTEYKNYEIKELQKYKIKKFKLKKIQILKTEIFEKFLEKIMQNIEEQSYYIKDILEENEMLYELININKDKYDEAYKKYLLIDTSIKINKKEVKTFIRRCPQTDCKGFLSTQLKCGICENYACKDCHEPKKSKNDEDHKCNPDTVETIKLLSSDTKPCPSCATQIFKIIGCDQMYCTQCHTPFSWIRGTIETGVIHNPHFYEFQRQQNGGVAPRVAGDINRCGGIDAYDMNRLINISYEDMGVRLDEHYRLINHIREVELLHYINTERNHFSDEKLRIKFLLGNIGENDWLKVIKSGMKKAEKNTEINKVLTMFCDTISFTLGNIVTKYEKHNWEKEAVEIENIKKDVESLESLRKYTNNVLTQIGNRFKNTNPCITTDWNIIHNSNRV